MHLTTCSKIGTYEAGEGFGMPNLQSIFEGEYGIRVLYR